MPRSTSRGKCSLCGKDYGKGQMTTHLKSCLRKAAGSVSAKGGSGAEKSRAFHLVVEGYRLAEYWMHLEAPVSETLEDLDHLLRQTWLECCGHLSCFVVGRQVYSSFTGDDFFDPSDDESMDFKLGQVLRPGLKFKYEYDFGDPTELALRVVAETEMPWRDIRLLARNAPPTLTCHACGEAATQICTECYWEGEGLLCDKCAGGHGRHEDMSLPVVNSPRSGQCAFTGLDYQDFQYFKT